MKKGVAKSRPAIGFCAGARARARGKCNDFSIFVFLFDTSIPPKSLSNARRRSHVPNRFILYGTSRARARTDLLIPGDQSGSQRDRSKDDREGTEENGLVSPAVDALRSRCIWVNAR